MNLAPAQLADDWRPGSDSLDGRVVLITGATGGLGRASALACAAAGATVVLVGRKVRRLEPVYDAVAALGGATPAIFPMDLAGSSPREYDQLAEAIEREFGRLDGIVHAAAHFGGLTPLAMQKPDTWLIDLQVNLTAPFLLMQALGGLFEAAPDPSAVFVLDDPARMGRAHWGGYGVAKAGLADFVSILAAENRSTTLRVHALQPAPMRTALRRVAWFGENPADVAPPEATAPVVVHLLSAAGAPLRGSLVDLRALRTAPG